MARLAPTNDFTERSGEYHINDNSIDCDLCRQTAPQFFTRSSVGNIGISEVQRQPLTLQEQRTCRDALEACPVDDIGYKLF